MRFFHVLFELRTRHSLIAIKDDLVDSHFRLQVNSDTKPHATPVERILLLNNFYFGVEKSLLRKIFLHGEFCIAYDSVVYNFAFYQF